MAAVEWNEEIEGNESDGMNKKRRRNEPTRERFFFRPHPPLLLS